jgi:hypothetical protein|uniref:Nucleotide-diphospho-sugar transferase domain-containing protein n=1 Tax=viral metagenome TaxID=1070528 RepID=A0A6C0JRD8_9ZZZZ
MKFITSVVNNIKFIELQYYSLKKFYIGDFEYIVFNDAKNFEDSTNNNDTKLKNKITQKCNELNIKCIINENDNHININSSSFRHSTVLDKMLEYQKDNLDEYIYLDSDIFFIDYFDIQKFREFKCAIVLQCREYYNTKHHEISDINYIWPGLCYFNINTNLSLLNWGLAEKCDTGGMSNTFLIDINNDENYFPKINQIRYRYNTVINDNIYYIKHLWAYTWNKIDIPDNLKNNSIILELLEGDNRNNENYACELYNNNLLHYRAGSGWDGKNLENLERFCKLLKDYISK